MVEFIKEIMQKIKSKVLESLNGQMAEFMRGCGKMDANMAKVNIKGRMECGVRACGKMEPA